MKIHVKPSLGVENFNAEEAQAIAGQDPDYLTRSVFEDLNKGVALSWKVYAQIIDPEKARNSSINIFDPTKTFPQGEFPLTEFGKIVLDKNVDNFFAESEQSAFSPTNLVPGWALTPDPSKRPRALLEGNLPLIDTP